MDHTVPQPLSPLARRLQELVQTGIVHPAYVPTGDFPSARVVVPVYDSAGTFWPADDSRRGQDAELARDTE